MCAIYPVKLNFGARSIGGVTCHGGMMAGKYLFIQNTVLENELSLAEIAAFGYEMK